VNVLAVLSQKGGTGKSHSVRSLAIAALIDGRKVAIIDADPQGTVIAWGKRRQNNAPTIVALGSQTVASQVKALEGKGADLVVIDTPPHAQPIINMAAEASTACLIVTGAFLEELETVATVATIAKSMKKPAAIVLNRVGRSHALTLARTALGTFGLPVCPTAMAQLITHAYASAEGETSNEREPDGKAAQEVTAVYEWLKKTGLL
jgi:chromosome partitioning protein